MKGAKRLATEKAINRLGFDTYKEVNDACNAVCEKMGHSFRFHSKNVEQYVNCRTGMSVERLVVLAEVLRVRDLRDLEEVFVPPVPRGVGKDWVGNFGHTVKDYDDSHLDIGKLKDM